MKRIITIMLSLILLGSALVVMSGCYIRCSEDTAGCEAGICVYLFNNCVFMPLSSCCSCECENCGQCYETRGTNDPTDNYNDNSFSAYKTDGNYTKYKDPKIEFDEEGAYVSVEFKDDATVKMEVIVMNSSDWTVIDVVNIDATGSARVKITDIPPSTPTMCVVSYAHAYYY